MNPNKMRSVYILLFLSLSLPFCLRGQDNKRHYVSTRIMTEEDGSRFCETVDYYNSFGCKEEEFEKSITPQGGNLRTLFRYDGAFRQITSGLPQPSDNPNFYNDPNPYDYTIYDHSALNRIRESYGAGQAWQENERSVKYDYLTNTSSGVLCCSRYTVTEWPYDIRLTRTGNYQPGELSVLRVMDEDGHITYTFTDYEGRLILTRQMNGWEAHDTYIVYDGRGRKRVVLPPLAADSLSAASTWSCNENSAIRSYGYLYRYDGRDRCIEKKLPGCAPVYYVYDRGDRLILKQDGNDREARRWQCYQYDGLGRLAIWGFLTSTRMRAAWDKFYGGDVCTIEYKGSEEGTNYGYTSIPGISELCTPLIINYYDNYDYMDLSEGFISYLVRPYPPFFSSFNANIPFSLNKLTGRIVALLNDPSKLEYDCYYYDDRGREVLRTEHSPFDFNNYIFTDYNFTGQPVSIRKEHDEFNRNTPSIIPGGKSYWIVKYEYEYDHAGRLFRVYQTFDDNPRILTREYVYDEVGRIEKKLLHNHSYTSTYKYNVRGWPTEINEPGMSEKIYYNEDLPQGVQPLYNGNIAALSNSASGNLLARFTYDELKRLTGTKQYKPDGKFVETPEEFTYDKMGNLTRYWRSYNQPYPTYINRMTIKYNGNQIQSVLEESPDIGYYTLRYQNDRNTTVEYFYDSNGNLTKNLDNRIKATKYNILNLPEVIVFGDGNLLTYSYMADGRKVRDSYGSYPVSSSTPIDDVVNNADPYITGTNDWNDDYYYESGELRRITTPEGFISFYNRTGYSTYYTSKDHVGSVWKYWDGTTGKVMGYHSYYPSGILYNKPIADFPFALGGKEFMGKNYLNEYFFGARTMFAIMNRFNQMDPLCETDYSVSPYVYARNNPVRFTDPTGRIWKDPLAAQGLQRRIHSRSASLEEEIAKNQAKIDEGGLSDEKIAELEGEIAEMEERISNLAKSWDDIDLLGKDEKYTYAFSYINDEIHKVFRGDDGLIYIETSSDGMSIHEITHIRQSLNAGGLRFSPKGELYNAGRTQSKISDMEIEAYKMGYSFDQRFPGKLKGKGLKGIDVYSVGGIRNNGKPLYRIINEYSIELKKQQQNR